MVSSARNSYKRAYIIICWLDPMAKREDVSIIQVTRIDIRVLIRGEAWKVKNDVGIRALAEGQRERGGARDRQY